MGDQSVVFWIREMGGVMVYISGRGFISHEYVFGHKESSSR